MKNRIINLFSIIISLGLACLFAYLFLEFSNALDENGKSNTVSTLILDFSGGIILQTGILVYSTFQTYIQKRITLKILIGMMLFPPSLMLVSVTISLLLSPKNILVLMFLLLGIIAYGYQGYRLLFPICRKA